MTTQPNLAELQTRISAALSEYHSTEDQFTRAASTVKQAAYFHIELGLSGDSVKDLAKAAGNAYRDSFCIGTKLGTGSLVHGISTWIAYAIEEGS